jgi:hypothetical protein
MTTAALFTLKKKRTATQCSALRCLDPACDYAPPGEPWQLPEDVPLCNKHLGQVLTHLESGAPEQPSTALAVVVEQVPILADVQVPATWVQRASEVLVEIQQSEQEAVDTVAALAGVEVQNHAELVQVNDYLRDAKTRRNRIKAIEAEVLDPLKQILKRIGELTAPAKKAWELAEGTLRGIVTQAALAEAERNRQLAEQAAAAHAAGEDAATVVGRMTTSTDLQGTTVTFVWAAVVDDVSQLPEVYVERRPNVQKLKEYAASFQGREPAPLPGVSFIKDAPLRVRGK